MFNNLQVVLKHFTNENKYKTIAGYTTYIYIYIYTFKEEHKKQARIFMITNQMQTGSQQYMDLHRHWGKKA